MKTFEEKLGDKLFCLLRDQRNYFIRTADNKKIITNHLIFNSLEDELAEVQRQIGRENKRKVIAECKKKGWSVPKFHEGRI